MQELNGGRVCVSPSHHPKGGRLVFGPGAELWFGGGGGGGEGWLLT